MLQTFLVTAYTYTSHLSHHAVWHFKHAKHVAKWESVWWDFYAVRIVRQRSSDWEYRQAKTRRRKTWWKYDYVSCSWERNGSICWCCMGGVKVIIGSPLTDLPLKHSIPRCVGSSHFSTTLLLNHPLDFVCSSRSIEESSADYFSYHQFCTPLNSIFFRLRLFEYRSTDHFGSPMDLGNLSIVGLCSSPHVQLPSFPVAEDLQWRCDLPSESASTDNHDSRFASSSSSHLDHLGHQHISRSTDGNTSDSCLCLFLFGNYNSVKCARRTDVHILYVCTFHILHHLAWISTRMDCIYHAQKKSPKCRTFHCQRNTDDKYLGKNEEEHSSRSFFLTFSSPNYW